MLLIRLHNGVDAWPVKWLLKGRWSPMTVWLSRYRRRRRWFAADDLEWRQCVRATPMRFSAVQMWIACRVATIIWRQQICYNKPEVLRTLDRRTGDSELKWPGWQVGRKVDCSHDRRRAGRFWLVSCRDGVKLQNYRRAAIFLLEMGRKEE